MPTLSVFHRRQWQRTQLPHRLPCLPLRRMLKPRRVYKRRTNYLNHLFVTKMVLMATTPCVARWNRCSARHRLASRRPFKTLMAAQNSRRMHGSVPMAAVVVLESLSTARCGRRLASPCPSFTDPWHLKLWRLRPSAAATAPSLDRMARSHSSPLDCPALCTLAILIAQPCILTTATLKRMVAFGGSVVVKILLLATSMRMI
mmetsp:Transcript_10322/g.23141  ORF Transcript_10322/g.23141 Transcript_10322/m.23141 type:complete len:202 (-) Transcript_10322:432-1037(-)